MPRGYKIQDYKIQEQNKRLKKKNPALISYQTVFQFVCLQLTRNFFMVLRVYFL